MKHENYEQHFVFFGPMHSGISDPKNPIWVSTTGITYPSKELAEEANNKLKKRYKHSNIKYRIIRTSVYKEVV